MKNKFSLSNANKTTLKHNFLGYLYLLPTLVITAVFVVYPLIMSFRMGSMKNIIIIQIKEQDSDYQHSNSY